MVAKARQSDGSAVPDDPAQDHGGEDADLQTSPLQAISGFVADDAGGDFHKMVNDRVRLGILSSLAVRDRLSFTEMKKLLNVSDGNLSVHSRKLEDAGYVRCSKTFADRMPRTEYRITAEGRRALNRYLKHMEALIRATSRGD
jgi:DNA-binding HxlR family transcriptional regulator